MNYGLKEEEWKRMRLLFSRFPHIERAVLFGSRAKGTNKPYSDVDIALEGNSLTVDDILLLQNEIDDLLLPYEFDICIYKDLANVELKNHIDRRGITIYDKVGSKNSHRHQILNGLLSFCHLLFLFGPY